MADLVVRTSTQNEAEVKDTTEGRKLLTVRHGKFSTTIRLEADEARQIAEALST